MMRIILALLLIATPAAAQRLPEGSVLALFRTTADMRAAVVRLSLPDGNAYSQHVLRWRLDPDDVPAGQIKMLPRAVDCRLYGASATPCVPYAGDDGDESGLFAVRAPYEFMPPDHVPKLDEWNGPLSHIETGLTTKTPTRWVMVNDDALRQAFRRLNPRDSGDYHIMQLGLALVPEEAVQGANSAWAKLESMAVQGQTFACQSDGLCHVVIRIGAADSTDTPLIGVCRTFRFVGASGTWLGPPVDCRVMASTLDGKRRLLAIVDVRRLFEGGDNYPSIADVRGLPSDNRMKELLGATLQGMGLTLSAAKGSRVIGDTPIPRLDVSQNAYLRRFVSTDFEGGADIWWGIEATIWVSEFVQNRQDRAMVRHDLEAVEIERFRKELLKQLRVRCTKVSRDTTTDSGHGLICSGYHAPS